MRLSRICSHSLRLLGQRVYNTPGDSSHNETASRKNSLSFAHNLNMTRVSKGAMWWVGWWWSGGGLQGVGGSGGLAQTVAQWPQAGEIRWYLLVVKLSLIFHPRIMRCVSSGEREQGLGGLCRQKYDSYRIKTNKHNSRKISAAKSLLGKYCLQRLSHFVVMKPLPQGIAMTLATLEGKSPCWSLSPQG